MIATTANQESQSFEFMYFVNYFGGFWIFRTLSHWGI